jgi:hypothetical protein
MQVSSPGKVGRAQHQRRCKNHRLDTPQSMKRNNNFKKSKKTILTAPQMELSKTVSMNRNSLVTVNIIYPIKIWTYTTSSNYSFSNGNDVRDLAFLTILSNTFPFADFALVYSDFRIISASSILVPVSLQSESTGILYQTCDPSGASSNPNNTTVIGTQSAHIFTAISTAPKSVTYRFPGTGTNTNIWQSVSLAPVGAFYIGSNTSGSGYGSNFIVFDASYSLTVQFRNVKTS